VVAKEESIGILWDIANLKINERCRVVSKPRRGKLVYTSSTNDLMPNDKRYRAQSTPFVVMA
jgi:hypothetical protein